MKMLRPAAQLLGTILISLSISSTVLKTIVLLAFWTAAFWPLKPAEIIQFFIVNVIFVISNYGALKNGVFEFAKKDILLMPYNELFMWGFYCLFVQRTLQLKDISQGQRKASVIYAAVFAVSFSVIRDEVILAGFLATLLLSAVAFFRSKQDMLSVALFTLTGILIESSGLWKGFWYYPHARYFELPLWGPLMWANIGMIVSRIAPALVYGPLEQYE
ncbi:MAG: hypothetical protein ACJ763_06080 [Bdellovibrionia bacterium]